MTVSAIALELPPFFEPADAANVDISLTVSNMMTAARVTGEIAVIAKIGTHTMKWNPDNKTWAEDTGAFAYNFSIEAVGGTDPTWGYRVSIYTPASRLGGSDYRTTITNLPANDDEVDYRLFVRIIFQPANLETESRSLIQVSGIEVRTTAGDGRADVLSAEVPVSSLSTSDCSVSFPIRDGGYHLNMKAVLTCPITDVQDEPIVSWLAPTERGDLLHIAGEGILRLRSAVSRQIAGELRCRRTVDLNSLFEDRKFTRAVYYLNSLELLAARQVYNVQLRELQSLDRTLPVGVLTPVRTFDEPMELVCSLYGSLFFRTGTGPYGVAIYNTENGELLRLAYASDSLAIRKGLSAVVIQVGTTDLYAVDNLGSVLSHLDSGPSSVLNFATALYDGDRHSWVSYRADSATSKSDVTIFTRNMELESKDSMPIVATGLMLISNGYVLQESYDSSWWHNYELHPSEKIEALDDRVETVSDSLLVTRSGGGTRIEFGIRRRSGQLFDADLQLSTEPVPGMTGMSPFAICNCAVAVFHYMDARRYHFAGYYDARTRKSGALQFESAVDVALVADRIYILRGQELLGFRLDDVPKIDYWLRLDDYELDITMANISGAGDDSIAVWVESNGTPYIVSQDSRLTAALIDRGNGLGCEIVVPANTSSVPITYDPVVIGIEEDDSVRRSITIEQQAN